MTPAIEARAAAEALAAAGRVAEAMRGVPGVRVRLGGGAVIVEGRALAARRLAEAAFRWPGEAAR